MDTMFYAWLVVSVIALLLEMGSPGLFLFLSFFFSGIATAFFSIWVPSVVWQCTFFLIATFLVLIPLRKWVLQRGAHYHPHGRSNVYALQGKRGRVTKPIVRDQPGQVKIGGELWLARSRVAEQLDVGMEVEVVDVRGAHVVVEPKKQ